MTRDRFQLASDLFLAARRVPPAEREGFLAERCAGDAVLRTDVERLLAHDDFGDARPDPLGTLAVADALRSAAGEAVEADAALPRDIGRYRILRCIGAGGMGVVYEAQQESPDRRVAVKVMRSSISGAMAMRRFRNESQMLGRLQHPGIAQIYEAGTDDVGDGARPYFAMELIDGPTLTEYADEHRLDLQARLELIARVCDAVDHAHRKGVVHRDLKPGNILVVAPTGRKSDDPTKLEHAAQPKILDFGIARATDADIQMTTVNTDIGQVVGTVSYMSPEQATGDPAAIDARADVYALGVIAYQVLAGRLPYDLARCPLPEAVRVITQDDPTPLSAVNRGCRGDVETIVAKALEKSRERRYQTAAALAEDIRRSLRDEPIVARRAGAAYQLRKFALRNKILVGGVAAVIVVLTLGVVGTSIGLARSVSEARKAARMNEYLKGMIAFLDPSEVRKSEITLRQMLDAAAARVTADLSGEPEVAAGVLATIADGYLAIGAYEPAEATAMTALEMESATHGAAEPATAEAWERLGNIRFHAGAMQGAEDAIRAALAIRDRTLAPGDRRVLIDLRDLMHALQIQGKHDAMQALSARVAALPSRLPASITDDAALSIHLAADMLATGQDIETAGDLYRRSLDTYRRVPRSAEPSEPLPEDYFVCLLDYALLLQMRREWPEAEAISREALDVARSRYGAIHPQTLVARSGLVATLRAQGKLDEALVIADETLAVARTLFGDDTENMAVALLNLATIHRELGRPEEAVAGFARAVEIRRAGRPVNETELARSLGGLGNALLDTGRIDEAEPVLRECLDMRSRMYPAHHPSVATTRSLLGAVLIERGAYDEAESLLLDAWRILGSAPATAPPVRRAALRRLIDLYERSGRPDAAAVYRALPDAPATPEP